MDIRSKLGIYNDAGKRTIGGNDARNDSDKSVTGQQDKPLPSLPGEIIYNDDGQIFLLENRYPVSYLYGGCRLGDAFEIKPEILEQLNGTTSTSFKRSAPAGFPRADRFLYLDTETTGLSGGTGTVAFLVGIGFFNEDEFVVRQYFMRDYDEEPAMLRELNTLLSSFDGLVTFNGRSFDWNLLNTRFIQNRIKPAVREPVNIDLLFPARRIWSLKLESCRLSSLEENVLDEHRIDDIPGAFIPAVYFKYLEDGDTTDIKRVLSHNEFDILSMVALLVRMAVLLETPQLDSPGYELMGVGKILQACGNMAFTADTLYVECFEACSRSDIYSVKAAAIKHLTNIYKRNGEYEKAMGHWQAMVEDSNGLFNLAPMVEMAKYYEHKEKNIIKALEIVDCAICSAAEAGLTRGREFAELRRRQERLRMKASS